MRLRSLLVLFLLTVAMACRPRLDGAKCVTTENCPDGQFCLDGRCAFGSDTGGGGGGSDGAGGGGSGGGTAIDPADGGMSLKVYEFTPASGQLQGGSMTLEVHIGAGTSGTKMTGGTLEVTGAAAIRR